MSSIERLKASVPAGIRQRGDSYFRAGLVHFFAPEGSVLTFTVRGSEPYHVTLTVVRNRLMALCGCPYFQQNAAICKHIWACVLELDSTNSLPDDLTGIRPENFVPSDDQSSTRTSSDEPDSTVVPFRRPARPEPLSRWKTVIDAVRRTSPRRAGRGSPGKIPDEILYVIRYSDSMRSAVGLAIRERSRKKSGEWGQTRRLLLDQLQISFLNPADREIILFLNASTVSSYRTLLETEYHLRADAAPLLIERMGRTGRLYAERNDRTLAGPLEWDDGPPWQLQVTIRQEESGDYLLNGSFTRDDEELPFESAILVAGHLLVREGWAGPLEPSEAMAWIDPLRKSGEVRIPSGDRTALISRLVDTSAGVQLGGDLATAQEPVECVPLFRLSPNTQLAGESFDGRLYFRYGEREVAPENASAAWIEGSKVVRRNPAQERLRQQELVSLGVNRSPYGAYLVRPSSLGSTMESLIRKGWLVEFDGQKVAVADELESEVTSGIDWFGIEGRARFGGERVELPALLSAFERRRPVIALEDGTLGIVPERWLDNFSGVSELAEKTGQGLRFRQQQALLIDALLAERQIFRDDQPLQSIKSRITGAQTVEASTESERFRGQLRQYQREGLGWLLYLRRTSLGGCLADDMGLGKTVQVLALLDLVAAENPGRPSLVIAPRSLLFNWKKEAERFTPHLRVLEHHGPQRLRDAGHFQEFDLVLTTYATMRLDVAHFRDREFEYVILDEAQAVKNATSQVAKSVRLLRSTHRLALSGTPIENHIGELWSLFEFLAPGLLGPSRWFQRTFAAKTVPPERRAILGSALRPLVLRRTKEQVAPELPARTEQTLYCELEGSERKNYDDLLEHYRATLVEKIRVAGIAGARMHVLEALLRLRQAASHPGLLPGSTAETSSKMELLLDELAEVIEGGHRALVFSQFTSFLALVRKELDRKKIDYVYLDGATRKRAALVETFQRADGPPLFLISMKAGGLGLNLTAADYVFLLDPWWNPAVEAQAIDRAHRIGQEKPVVAYRLIARDTVEEKILDLQASKRDLASSVITDENSLLQTLDAEQLQKLLS